MATSTGETVDIDGKKLKVTNLDKVLYPESNTTKRDVIDYYARIAEVLIPHAANRPATRKRWVHGVGTTDAPGDMFFQKNLDDSTPAWVKRRSIEHSDHSNEYPLVNDRATLAWLAQIAALEIHVPQWQFGRTGVRKNPDRLVLDLDPGPGAGLLECAEVARWARDILQEMGLEPMPVTSGSKGIHLYAALDGKYDSDAVSSVAHELARALEADHPDLVVSDMKKSLRDGKVLVDWSQNNGSKTTVAPYSLRGRSRPMVAAPRTWRELSSPSLEHLDFKQVLARVAKKGDILAALNPGHLEPLETETKSEDRLQKYRSMRDASKTPEPVPEAPSGASNGQTFVIQEHHARRLHYDFRLEHDGVLVSWAIPKGVPTDRKTNHLAVQTEDHPLEYGSFEGEIPAGEYGGGTVTIWDAGTFELEKWRDGKEVIATLHGEKHGSHRYALIHTGGEGKAANNWLIHLMEDADAASATTHEPHSHSRSSSARTPRPTTSAPADRPRPMLATLGSPSDITDPEDWAFEMKWDGYRAVAEVRAGEVRLWSRNGNELTKAYPELQELAASIDHDAVVDGEVIAIGRGGRPDFSALQSRSGLSKKADVERAMASTPVRFVVFDVLSIGSESLVALSYDERRSRLDSLVNPRGPVDVSPAFEGDLDAAIDSSRTLGLEGVMAKRRSARYAPGRRSDAWVKIKHHSTQEVVVIGWRPGKGNRSHRVGSLLMAIPSDDGLRYAGRVGTGFTEKDLDALAPRLARLERKTNPAIDVPAADARDAQWVTPSLVGEVEFAEWTATGRIRQPSWRGFRPDKAASEVVLES